MNRAITKYTEYLLTAESKELRVLVYLREIRTSDSAIVTTLSEAADSCGVTKATVNKVFQKLYKSGYLRSVSRGRYTLRDFPE